MAERASLVARTRRLDTDLDLLAFAGDDGVLFERERCGLAGRGEVTGIELPALDPVGAADTVAEVLGSIIVDDEVGLPGTGPVAFAALPFDPAAPARLVIPRFVAGRAEDGTRWLTTVTDLSSGHPDGADTPALFESDPSAEHQLDPGVISVSATRSPSEWCEALTSGRDRLRASQSLDKFVFAREVVVEFERPVPRRTLLDRLRRSYPSCYITSVGSMIGASPELLLSRTGDIVRSRPMAGTAPRSADPTTDSRLAAGLLASTKDRHEHQITIDMVHDTLLPWCSYLDAEAEPSIVAMANVQHLATYLEGRLSSPPASVIELLRALHPTPAVGGSPTDEALGLIRELEGLDRGAYAGPVGWVDHRGNGEWAVGIRSAELDGNRARVFAGVGVVADSDPDAELAETRSKLQAILSVLVRP
jgi:menaquinone-specific isochorismate synthase